MWHDHMVLKKKINNSCNCVEFSLTSHVYKIMFPLFCGQKYYIIA
jgi:hypothetical protein